MLEQVGLGKRGGDRVSGYSTGMRQRLGIAAALLRSPTAAAARRADERPRPGGGTRHGPSRAPARRRGHRGAALEPPDRRPRERVRLVHGASPRQGGLERKRPAAARPGPGVGVPAGDQRRRPRARDRRAASERARDPVAHRRAAARGAEGASTPTCSTSAARTSRFAGSSWS